jgi:hypothetical protein
MATWLDHILGRGYQDEVKYLRAEIIYHKVQADKERDRFAHEVTSLKAERDYFRDLYHNVINPPVVTSISDTADTIPKAINTGVVGWTKQRSVLEKYWREKAKMAGQEIEDASKVREAKKANGDGTPQPKEGQQEE